MSGKEVGHFLYPMALYLSDNLPPALGGLALAVNALKQHYVLEFAPACVLSRTVPFTKDNSGMFIVSCRARLRGIMQGAFSWL